MPKPKLVALYTRISHDRQHLELATDRQEERCRQFCASREWAVGEVYRDVDISAYKNVQRPEYERLLADIEAGTVTGVVVWKLDRLVRRITEFSRFWEACEAREAFVTSATEPFDTSTPVGLGIIYLLVSLAEQESRTRSERQSAKHLQLARSGKGKGGGTRPFGFAEDRVTHVPAETKAIRDAARKVLNGATLRGVCAEWNRSGLDTVTGTPWNTTVLKRVLVAPRTAGLRQHQGETILDDRGEPVRAEWQPIIDAETSQQLQALLNDPARATYSGRARRYLFTGFAFCSECGAKLVARPRADKRRCYVCASGPGFNGCGKIRILADTFERYVCERVGGQLLLLQQEPDTPADDEQGTERALLQAELQETNRKLIELGAMWEAGEIVRSQLASLTQELTNKQETLQTDLAKLAVSRSGYFADLFVRAQQEIDSPLDFENLDPLEFDYWRNAIAAIARRIVVYPAIKGQNFFNPARVEVRWIDEPWPAQFPHEWRGHLTPGEVKQLLMLNAARGSSG